MSIIEQQPAVAVASGVLDVCARSRVASRALAVATTATKDAALNGIAEALVANAPRIVAANAEDLERGAGEGLASNLLDRLKLDEARIAAIAAAVKDVVALPDPVGEIVRGSTRPNGLKLRQVRVPLGVVAMIYEARPNVTVDAAVLALKAGNAAVLRGGSAAASSNAVIVSVIQDALEAAGLPRDGVLTIDPWGREGATELMRTRGSVDVLIPRGGAGLIKTVVENSVVPVIETGWGNVHVYVDRSADLDQALEIVLNSKTHRTSVCNSAETLLVHRDVVEAFLGRALVALDRTGVKIHADEPTEAVAASAGVPALSATDEDWATEYLAMEMAVAVVDDVAGAIEHIRTWSSGHTEAICATDVRAIEKFTAEVDSAAVVVNASTRFTDGGEFGLGAEIGISTQKLHARGPMGLAEITSTKWIVTGDGQIRG